MVLSPDEDADDGGADGGGAAGHAFALSALMVMIMMASLVRNGWEYEIPPFFNSTSIPFFFFLVESKDNDNPIIIIVVNEVRHSLHDASLQFALRREMELQQLEMTLIRSVCLSLPHSVKMKKVSFFFSPPCLSRPGWLSPENVNIPHLEMPRKEKLSPPPLPSNLSCLLSSVFIRGTRFLQFMSDPSEEDVKSERRVA